MPSPSPRPFDPQLFRKPSASFRGAPFWALNHDLTDHTRLREQIDVFQAMGMGGYHLHVRAGLRTPYMGAEFLAAIAACRMHGAGRGLLSYLYDEDTWPSGFAGGEVTRGLAFRQRWAVLGREPPREDERTRLLAAYRVMLDAVGRRTGHARIDPAEADDGCWFLSRTIAGDNDRYNGAAYLDVLNPNAVDAFIASTHERYLAFFGGAFPDDVPSIFTDEPAFIAGVPLAEADAGAAQLPWTDDLPETFAAAWNDDLLDRLPEVIWPGPGGPGVWRWRFWDHLAERFASAFADRVGAWCDAHGIDLTGHLLDEPRLKGQVTRLGEAMRHYRAFQVPGIDMLCDGYEPSTAKQAVSVARQDGRAGVLSELYGVTNWDFPFRGHKAQGDWQAALGVTRRAHHLAWLSMEGESKRDYPAAIGPQSPWHAEYPLVEDHFARVNVALACGRPSVRIGVLHPIESAWMHWGVDRLDADAFDDAERRFHALIDTLLEGQLDFDFIAESLLPRQQRPTDAPVLQVGAMAYEAVVVPELTTIRGTTLASLRGLLDRGGAVFVLGAEPPCCDGAASEAPVRMLDGARRVAPSPAALLEALAPWRDLEVARNGHRHGAINYQIRIDGDERVLFCCHRQREHAAARPWTPGNTLHDIRVRGAWRVSELDTADGEERACAFVQDAGWTCVPWDVQPHSHRLLRLRPGAGEARVEAPRWTPCGDAAEPVRVRREEPNVLLLDRAAWRLEDEPWQPVQESLRTARQLARRFGWPDWAQPYSVTDRGTARRVARRFLLACAVAVRAPRLVCERLHDARIRLDGAVMLSEPDGWWVDRDLTTMTLPDLAAGEHVLEVELPLDAVNRHLEWCYLLGEFGVEVRGAHARVVADRDDLVWGDAASQGLPFYGGNLDYDVRAVADRTGSYALRCPGFAGPLVRVTCDGRDGGPVAYAPYRADLGRLEPGEHRIRIRVFGNRHNSFGALHNSVRGWTWWGPPSWRTEDAGWNDAWQLRPLGMTRAPIFERLEDGREQP